MVVAPKVGPRTRLYLATKGFKGPEGDILRAVAMQFMQVVVDSIATETGKARKDGLKVLDGLAEELAQEMRRTMRKKIDSLPHLKGDAGYTPKKGTDYFDGEPGEPGATPVANVDYLTVERTQQLVAQAADRVYKLLQKEGMTKKQLTAAIAAAMQDINGKAIARALEMLTGADRLDYLALKNRPGVDVKEAQGTHGLHRGGGLGSVLTPTSGSVDDANLTFVFSRVPKLVNVNGSFYRHGKGASIAGVTVTLDNPVGVGGDIYALA